MSYEENADKRRAKLQLLRDIGSIITEIDPPIKMMSPRGCELIFAMIEKEGKPSFIAAETEDGSIIFLDSNQKVELKVKNGVN